MTLDRDWEPQVPAADFADRVMARALREEREPRRRPWRWYAIAGATLAAAAAIVMITRPTSAVRHGELRATARVEVAVGSRAVAVVEPGTHIRWHGDVVEQDSGQAFYRVEPGEAFEVRTPAGNATVAGTCFRITVQKEQDMMKRDLGAGAIGAVVAVGIVVGVYEGKVRVSHAGQATTVGAGETVVSDRTGVHAQTTVARTEDAKAPHTSDELKLRLAQIEQEKTNLERELESALAGTPPKSEYDLSRDDWQRLAKQGTIKYEVPCFRDGGFRPTPEQIQHMGLAAADADTIQAAFRQSNQRFATNMTAICGEVGPEEAKDMSKCMTKLFATIYERGTDSARPIYTRVAEVRAGTRTQAPAADTPPAEKMLLFFTGEMSSFESDLAKTFGADEAHRIAYSSDLCFQANSY